MKQLCLTSTTWILLQTFAFAAPEGSATSHRSVSDLLSEAGLMLYPLIALSLVTVIMILTFLMTLRRNAMVSDAFMTQVEDLIKNRDIQSLRQLSANEGQTFARVTQRVSDFLLKNRTATIEEVRELIQIEGSRQANAVLRKISYLADIGSLAPMIGLLGTVIGMMRSFLEMESAQQGVKQFKLAVGVSEALVTTAGGLAICIPALAFYAFFRGKAQRLNSDLESACAHISSLFNAQYQAARQVKRQTADYQPTSASEKPIQPI